MQGEKLFELIAIPLLVGLAGTILYLRFERDLKRLAETRPSIVTGIAGALLIVAAALVLIPTVRLDVRQPGPILIEQSMSIWRAAAIGAGVIFVSLSEAATANISRVDERQMVIAALLAPIRASYIMGLSFLIYKTYGVRSSITKPNYAAALLLVAFVIAKSAADRWAGQEGRPQQYAKYTVGTCTAVSWACVIIILWL